MDDIIFIPDGHQYVVNGQRVPSVSDLISPFSEPVEDTDVEFAFESAAERGTMCHKVLEMLLSGIEDPEYPDAYEPYVEAIRMFLSEHEIEPIAIETPVFSEELGAAGTPDLLCIFDGAMAILDYKFVAQIAKTRVKAQLNAYRKMYNENGVFPEALKAIQFLKDGTYRIYDVAIGDEEISLCARLYALKNKKHARGRID